MTKMYPVNHPWVRENYPYVYWAFMDRRELRRLAVARQNMGSTPVLSGYDSFRQVGMFLREKQKLKAKRDN